jgi:hypothetical protein
MISIRLVIVQVNLYVYFGVAAFDIQKGKFLDCDDRIGERN